MKRFIKALSLLALSAAVPSIVSAQTSFTANNTGRATAQFFSNISADNDANALQCNLGFFGQGAFDAGCLNQTAGTYANQFLLNYDSYFGTDGGTPPAMQFDRGVLWQVTLVGSVAGGTSEVGWFYLDAGSNYVFNPLSNFGSKVINSTYYFVIPNEAQYGGLYLANNFNPELGGCSTGGAQEFYCSDANGGWTTVPTQQWAALISTTGDCRQYTGYCYLFGAEDNKLELMPNGAYRDSDYNDYMIAANVVPEPVTMGLLATGLVGMVGVGFMQRRRNNPKGTKV